MLRLLCSLETMETMESYGRFMLPVGSHGNHVENYENPWIFQYNGIFVWVRPPPLQKAAAATARVPPRRDWSYKRNRRLLLERERELLMLMLVVVVVGGWWMRLWRRISDGHDNAIDVKRSGHLTERDLWRLLRDSALITSPPRRPLLTNKFLTYMCQLTICCQNNYTSL